MSDGPTFRRPARRREHVPGKVVVRFKPDAIEPAARSGGILPEAVAGPLDFLRRNAGLRDVDAIFTHRIADDLRPPARRAERHRRAVERSVLEARDERRAGVAVLTLPATRVRPELLRDLAGSTAIEYAEPLPARWFLGAPDPKRNLQWGLREIRYFDGGRPSAGTVKVGVLDSGYDAGHPDLPAPTGFNHDGLSDEDQLGHGTHVAGIIAARTNNGVGITGIAEPDLRIWKIFPDDERAEYVDTERYYQALGEAADQGVHVLNCSFGGDASAQAEADLLAAVGEAGGLVVAAMGNDFEEGNPTLYPAAHDGVLAVGAVDQLRNRASFSSTGPHISMCAPGYQVLSTLPREPSALREDTGYASWNGTSMAAPHVAAAAALVRAAHPDWSPGRVARRLRESASGVPQMDGHRFTEAHGSGLLNLRAALG